MLISFLLAKLGEKKNKKKPIVLAYIILTIISIIRYDIGNDYENYYDSITFLSGYDLSGVVPFLILEPSAIMLPILSVSFGFTSLTPEIVIGIYALLFFVMLYLVLEHYKTHSLGLLLLFILMILFQSWDWVKQGVSVMIVLYSIKYIEKRNPFRFVIVVLFGSLWHISAIFLLLLYPLRKLTFSSLTLTMFLFCIFFLTELGIFKFLYTAILQIVPLYNEVYENTKYSESEVDTTRTITFIILCVWYLWLLFVTPRDKSFYALILFVGAALYMISSGSLLLDRFSLYFTSIQLFYVPMLYRIYAKKKLYRCVFTLFFIFFYAWFCNDTTKEYGLRGSDKYETLFSDQYNRKYFRYRSN